MDLSERPAVVARRHPWETSRFRLVSRLLRAGGIDHGSLRVLDVGCGDGWFSLQLLSRMPRECTVTCWDSDLTPSLALALVESGGGRLAACTTQPQGRFDLILLLDVLEHVEEDVAFLTRIVAENLADGGHVLVTVPAYQQLYCERDRALRHFRRYSPGALRTVVGRAGLRVLRDGGAFHAGVAVRGISVLRERVSKRIRSEGASSRHELAWEGGAMVTGLAELALGADNLVSLSAARLRVRLPGLTVWALCRK